MDGKRSWRDNVFVERLWRSVKYEEVYLKAYETVTEARRSIGIYLNFYNRERPHSSLDGIPPEQFYYNNLLPLPLAAWNDAGIHLLIGFGCTDNRGHFSLSNNASQTRQSNLTSVYRVIIYFGGPIN